MAMPCSAQEERMPGRKEEKDAKASWNRASTDTLSSGGARLLSFSHDDATHMHTQSPRIRVYDATHPRKHQSMQFSYRLFNRYHPSWHVICHPRNHPSMVVDPHNLFLIIRPQVIHGQAPSPHVSYHSSTSHPWSGTLTNCYLSSIHKSSMVQAPSFHMLLISLHKSSMVQAPSFR